MQTHNQYLAPLYRYMRATIVHALGGEPKDYHSDEALDQFIAAHSRKFLNLLHDLIAMLDYLHDLIRIDINVDNEKTEVLNVLNKVIFEVKKAPN